MIKITNGRQALKVSAGAYESYFKHLGYRPVNAIEPHENSEQENVHGDPETPVSEDSTESSEYESTNGDPEVEEEPEYEEDLSEIPLGEMKLSQLIAYAEQLGLEHDGTPNKKELRALIRNHLNQQ